MITTYSLNAFEKDIYANRYLVILLGDLEFIQYQENMVNENDIPNILKFHSKVEDGEVYVYYKIDGYKRLSDILDSKLMKKQYLSILEAVVDALNARERYLLSDNSLLIHPDYIYVNDTGIKLVYLPTSLEVSAISALEQLVRTLGLHLDLNEVGAGDIAMRIQNTLLSMPGALKELKELIINLNQKENRSPHYISSNLAEVNKQVEEKLVQQPIRSSASPVVQPQVLPVIQTTQSLATDKPLIPTGSSALESGMPIPKKIETNTEKQVFLGKLFSKKNNAPKPNEKPKKPKKEKEDKAAKNAKLSNIPIPVPEPSNAADCSGTVFIPDAQATQFIAITHAYLIFLENGTERRKVFINKLPFVIGRQQGVADYIVENNLSISRRHAEITMIGPNYFITDESTGGTFINNIQLVSRQKVQLNSGDIVRFYNSEHIFRIE